MDEELMTGSSSSLSPWAGPYVTNMLGRGEALSSLPYAAYSGPLTAGASPLQQQAFSGIAGLTVPSAVGAAASGAGAVADKAATTTGFTPGMFTTGVWDTPAMQQYMSPYLTGALEPQIAEARRQAEIERVNAAGRLTKAGAYGGGRQAVIESEGIRNLLRNITDITGRGYDTAYQQALNAFNADENRKLTAAGMGEQSRQFGASTGLQALSQELAARTAQGTLGRSELDANRAVLDDLMMAGGEQRAIEGEGIAADLGQFREERDYPFKQVQYLQSLLQGLPISTQQYNYTQPSGLSQFMTGAGGILTLIEQLQGIRG